MAFLVWSRKDGRNPPNDPDALVNPATLRLHWGGIVTLRVLRRWAQVAYILG
jgi:hypothetical protein